MADLDAIRARANARKRKDTAPESGTVVAETKDGRIIRGVDGGLSFTSPGFSTNDPEIIERLMQGATVKDTVQSGFDRSTIAQAPITSRAVKAMEGVPFIGSFVDEAAGIGNPKATQGVRAVSAAMEREKPGQSTALKIGGGIAGAIPMALAAVPGIAAVAPAARWARMAAGAGAGLLAGGLEGAVYGSGQSEGEGRLANAKEQGQLGAGIGGLLGFLGPVAADLTEAGVKALKTSDAAQIAKRFGISKKAAAVVKNHVDSGDIAAARRALDVAGDDAMLGESTQGARSLLDAVAAKGGKSEAIVNEAIEGRVSRGNAAFRQVSDDVLGAPPQGLRTAAEEIAERTRPQRNAAYDIAFATPIDYASPQGRAVEEVLGRIPPSELRGAIQDANAEMLSLGMRNQQILADIADDGTVTFREMPNVRQLNEIKKSLDRGAARDAFGRIAPEGIRPSRLAGQVRDATVEATGGKDGTFAKALAIGGDKIAEDNALRMGSSLLSPQTTRDDVIRMMSGASTDARNSAKVGFRNAINEAMDNVRTVASDRGRDAREVRKAVDMLSSRAMREKAAIVLGKTEADRFFKEVDKVASGLNLRAAVSENSKTARRMAIQDDISAVSAPNVLQTAAGGEPVGTVKQVVQLLTGETADARAFRESGVAEDIARFLTQQKGKSAEAALNYINRAMTGQALTDQQAAFVGNMLATTGFLSGGQQGRQYLAPPR